MPVQALAAQRVDEPLGVRAGVCHGPQ